MCGCNIKNSKNKTSKKIKFSSSKYFNLSTYNTANLHKESNLFLIGIFPGVLGKKKSLKYKQIIKKN